MRHQVACDLGFLAPVEALKGEGAATTATTRWRIIGEPDTQICQTFLSRPRRDRKAPLERIPAQIRHTGSLRSNQAQIDALLLFVGLHRDYDLAKYAGVAPRIWRQDFVHVPPDWVSASAVSNFEDDLYSRVFDDSHCVVTLAQPSGWLFDEYEIGSVLATTEEQSDSRILRTRAAFQNLFDLGLIYRVVVAWDGEPNDPSSEPIGTVFVNDDRARERDLYSQCEHNRRIWRDGGLPSDFEKDGTLRSLTGERYRLVVPSGLEARVVGIRQIRLRHWAASHAGAHGQELERLRTNAFCQL